MYIKELKRNDGFTPIATIDLTYDEVRFVSNILCQASKLEDFTSKHKNFNVMRKRFLELATLMKHGTIPAFELDLMHGLIAESNIEGDE